MHPVYFYSWEGHSCFVSEKVNLHKNSFKYAHINDTDTKSLIGGFKAVI